VQVGAGAATVDVRLTQQRAHNAVITPVSRSEAVSAAPTSKSMFPLSRVGVGWNGGYPGTSIRVFRTECLAADAH
jgi:hypothetical protein